jgi:hypothetical protein
MAKRGLFMLLVVAAASAGPAYAQGDPACAKYQDPLAYNACLASHGPKATDLATLPRPAEQIHLAAPARAAPSRPVPSRSGWAWRHAVRGRVRMEFRLK